MAATKVTEEKGRKKGLATRERGFGEDGGKEEEGSRPMRGRV